MAELSIYEIIREPDVTEKSTRLRAFGKYIFRVNNRANSIQIKRAIEKLYKVKVEKVNTVFVKGKTKRLRFNQEGKTADYKKAIVTLKEGQKIDIV